MGGGLKDRSASLPATAPGGEQAAARSSLSRCMPDIATA